MSERGNEGAPPADPDRRRGGGGFPWGRIIVALIALLLLALLIPLACQALRGSGTEDEASQGASQDAEETTGLENAASGGGDTGSDAASGSGGETSGGGDTGSAASGGSGATTEDGGAQTASAEIAGLENQSGNGATLTVGGAAINGTDGWVAIHQDDNGSPKVPQSIGHAPIREGDNTDITVTLDEPVDSSQRLHAMIHADDPADGEYTFPDGDPPVEVDGEVVVEPLQYTVDENEPLPKSGGPGIPALVGAAAPLLAAMLLAAALLVKRFLSTHET